MSYSQSPGATFEAYQAAFNQLLGGGQFSPGNFNSPIGQKGLAPDLIKDFTSAQGLVPFNLEQGAKFVIPVFSPLRNIIPRDTSNAQGTARVVKAINGINTTNLSSWASEGVIGNQPVTSTVTMTVPYKIQAMFDAVTWEAQVFGQGFDDIRSRASTNLLRAFMIQEEKNIFFGQSSAPVTGESIGGASNVGGVTGAPGVGTSVTNTSGGTIANGTYNIAISFVTGQGESVATAITNQVTTGSGLSTITVTPPARVAGQAIIGFNVYYKLSTDATYNVVRTSGAPVLITSYALALKTLPGGDTTGNSLAFNGILPQIAATGSGAYTAFPNAPLTLQIIGSLFKNMWDNAQADPDLFIVNSQESSNITDLTLGAANTPYFLVVKDHDAATGGYRVGRLVNKITGSEVKIITHPYLPAGNIVALSTHLPGWYPGTEIDSVWKMEGPRDYTQFDYFPVGPRYPFEIRNVMALLLYLPAVQGWVGGLS